MSEASERELDPTQDALVTLVIRGMIRGNPDAATGQLVERGRAVGVQAALALAGRAVRLAGDGNGLERLEELL